MVRFLSCWARIVFCPAGWADEITHGGTTISMNFVHIGYPVQ